MSTKKIIKYWAPFFLWAVVIFLFSAYPTTRATQIYWQDFIVKKSAHIFEYGVFATLLYRALKNTTIVNLGSVRLWTFVAGVAYGASDEFHQGFTPGREPTLRDVGFDTIGVLIALFIIWKYLPQAPKTLRNWAKKLELI